MGQGRVQERAGDDVSANDVDKTVPERGGSAEIFPETAVGQLPC